MRSTRTLKDETYATELDRMRALSRFPEIPTQRQEMIRAMRKITESDRDFLHRVITYCVDNYTICPTSHELVRRAGEMRTAKKTAGSPACEKCGGSGWVSYTKTVQVRGAEPYEADVSQRCTCAPPERSGE